MTKDKNKILPAARENAKRVEAFLKFHPNSNMTQIELACDIQFNEWAEIKRVLNGRLHPVRHGSHAYTFTISEATE